MAAGEGADCGGIFGVCADGGFDSGGIMKMLGLLVLFVVAAMGQQVVLRAA